MPNETKVREEQRGGWLRSGEEWAATVVGLVLIVLVLAGVVPVNLLP
ncbi:hypothetical protein [Kribbella sp. NPDC051770]